jgi:hypothetical protein
VDTFLKLTQHVQGVELDHLEPMTTLLVWTRNSVYRVIIAKGSDVLVQGGTYFTEPTPAHVEGASAGGSWLKVGWIALGLLMEIRAGGQHIVTSPVVAIATARSDVSARH